MRFNLGPWAAAALAVALLQTSALASGSIKAGGAINPRDAYMQGKALTFEKLVCASCPIQKGALNRDRALSLKASLEAQHEANRPGTADDTNIQRLDRDEQEVVHYYLTRRYRL